MMLEFKRMLLEDYDLDYEELDIPVYRVKDPLFLAVIRDRQEQGESYLIEAADLAQLKDLIEQRVETLSKWGGSPDLLCAWDVETRKEIPSVLKFSVSVG